MRRRAFLGILFGSLAGCIGGGGPGESADEVVAVGPDGRFVFEPGTESALRIEPGLTVRFDWQSDTHNVVVERQPEGADWAGHESIEDRGFSFSQTFDVEGEYHYVCEPHLGMGMTGDIVVSSDG